MAGYDKASLSGVRGKVLGVRGLCQIPGVTNIRRSDDKSATFGPKCDQSEVKGRTLEQINKLLARYPDLSACASAKDNRLVPAIPAVPRQHRRYLRKVRPARGRVYQEVDYRPAQALQVDWGECGRVQVGSTMRKVSVFVAVHCYSRLLYIEFTLSQRKAEFYRGLVNALTFFGSSPRNLIFDNLKAAVLKGSGRSPASSPSLRPCAAISVCSRSPAPAAIRNRRALSKGACAM